MILSLLASLASAGEVEVGAILRPDFEIDVAPDRDREDGVAARTRIRAFASGETAADGRWFLEGRGVNEVLIGEDVEGRWEGELGESGWEGKLAGPVRLRAGNLVERWGKLDLLPIVDVLNPRDLRFGLVQPTEFQRTPVPMATVSAGSDVFRSETTWLPFPSHDRLALRDTDWSFVRQGMLTDQAAQTATWEGDSAQLLGKDNIAIVVDSLTDLEDSYRRSLDAALLEKNHPQDTFLEPEFAQRFAVTTRAVDFAVMGARIHSRQPLAEVNPFLVTLLQEERLASMAEIPLMLEAVGEQITVRYPMTWTAGAEASTVVGPLGVRAEAGWMSDKLVREQWGQASVVPSLAAGLGLDYVRGSSFLVTLEAKFEQLVDPPKKLLFAREQMFQVAGGVRWSVLAERLQIQLGGSYDVVFREYLILPKLTYRVDDHLQLEGGAMLLGGAETPPADLTEAMTWDGGLLGYFGQNDALTLGVVFIL